MARLAVRLGEKFHKRPSDIVGMENQSALERFLYDLKAVEQDFEETTGISSEQGYVVAKIREKYRGGKLPYG